MIERFNNLHQMDRGILVVLILLGFYVLAAAYERIKK